jgi:aminodeoxyfutalosine synthase
MLNADRYAMLGLGEIFDKVTAGERLSLEDGELLYNCPDITAVGALAHHVRTRMHGDRTYYVLNRQVNYTNICVNGCLFCAFQRERGQQGAYVMQPSDIVDRVLDDKGTPFTEVHIVGGCHPDLPLEWFEDVIRRIKQQRPEIVVKAFTAVEIAHFATLAGIGTAEVLARLKAAGLESMPGGGAEIFAPRVRERICARKATAQEWLRIAGEAHGLGITTNCTMLFGHIESVDDRLDHLDRLRRQQDVSGGFNCFIPLPFLTENSLLKLPEDRRGEHVGLDRLRTIAVSRLLLDNIPHIKAYWVMMGIKMAQTALYFGADDLDGTIVEERIGQEAGASSGQGLTISSLRHMITASGFTPVQRDTHFKPVEATL